MNVLGEKSKRNKAQGPNIQIKKRWVSESRRRRSALPLLRLARSGVLDPTIDPPVRAEQRDHLEKTSRTTQHPRSSNRPLGLKPRDQTARTKALGFLPLTMAVTKTKLATMAHSKLWWSRHNERRRPVNTASEDRAQAQR
ncbi:hypothetical protein Bca4012_057217 [Brassica carinata]